MKSLKEEFGFISQIPAFSNSLHTLVSTPTYSNKLKFPHREAHTAFSIAISKTFYVYQISSLNFPCYCRNSFFSTPEYDCLWWLFKMIKPHYHPISLYHSVIISWGAFCKVFICRLQLNFQICSTPRNLTTTPSSQGVKRNLRIFFFNWNSSLSCSELVYPNWFIVVWSWWVGTRNQWWNKQLFRVFFPSLNECYISEKGMRRNWTRYSARGFVQIKK